MSRPSGADGAADPATERVGVTAGVIVHAGALLLSQRLAGGQHARRWEFPGGKVEAGESLERCIQRELREELGIEATIAERLWCTVFRYAGRRCFELTFFAVSTYHGAVTNRAGAALQWVAPPALTHIDMLEADRDFIAQVASGRLRLRETRRR